MIKYLIVNMTLTCSALAIFYMMQIPYRIKFYTLMLAITAWLIPFGLISISLSPSNIQTLPIQSFQIIEQLSTQTTVIQSNFNWVALFGTMLFIGLIRFFIDLITTSKLISKLRCQSKPYNKKNNIRLTEGINGAFISGYFNPIIWVNEQLKQSNAFQTVITHEQQHIQSHDQFWLLIITLMQRLFWFNPLTYLLCQKARQSIELSCDEACKAQLGHEPYQNHLALLVLTQKHGQKTILNNHVNHGTNFNIYRIKQLKQENSMNTAKTIKLTAIGLLTILMSSISLISTAHEFSGAHTDKKLITLKYILKINDSEPAEFSMITKQGEMVNFTIEKNDFGFITQAIEAESDLIYTDIIISEINNGIRSEVANPSILSNNNEWASFKFNDKETYYDISIMATKSDNTDPEIEAIDNYLDKNDPAPQWLQSED